VPHASCLVLVKGAGDIGSAVAHRLFQAGFRCLIVEAPQPSVARRHMSFADALFEGEAVLEGVRAVRVNDPALLPALLAAGEVIPITTDLAAARALRPTVMVDARMRKRVRPERQIDEAPLTIGLGPGFRAGESVHAAVETNWGPHLGRVLWAGEPEPYTGQPRTVLGYGRERYLYAPEAGPFRTPLAIGQHVVRGQTVAWIGSTPLVAPIDGVIRGLTRDGVWVPAGTKVVDIDPRGQAEAAYGIGERPRQIAEGVLAAIQAWLQHAG
jgi:xanthine dehydrogenase accessory factor